MRKQVGNGEAAAVVRAEEKSNEQETLKFCFFATRRVLALPEPINKQSTT